MKDFYYILGTNRNCSPADINAAYRKLAQKLQPAGHEQDTFLDTHFQEITEAYMVLSDAGKRRKYDVAFRKSYQRRLYYFKIKHLNIAAMLALVGFTALSGYYVINSLRGSKVKKPVAVQAAAEPVTKRHKKKKIKTPVWVKTKPTKPAGRADATIKTLAKPFPVEEVQQVQAKPVAARKEQPQPIVMPQVQAHPVAAHKEQPQPVIMHQPIAQPEADRNYTSELLANVTGMVSLHQTADYRSPVMASIPNHAKVQVLEKGGSFYKIAFQNQTGYVPKWTVATP